MSETAAHAPPQTAAKYRGVRKRKWGKYVAEIRLPNSRERIWLGSYDTAEKAARAFDAALFCLRGSAANFNFSHDPPEIAGGQSLSPPEIQAAAQRYGNSYGGGQQEAAAADGEESEFPAQAMDLDNGATPSERAGPVDLIDGSFWEMVDMNGGGATGHNSGCVSDFGLFLEPGEMYVYPHYNEPLRVYEDEDEGYDQELWNF